MTHFFFMDILTPHPCHCLLFKERGCPVLFAWGNVSEIELLSGLALRTPSLREPGEASEHRLNIRGKFHSESWVG